MAKPSKSAKTERQRLIDETLKKQRSVEKRRGNIIVAAAVLIAAGIIAVPVVPMIRDQFQQSAYADDTVAQIGAAPSVCQKVKEQEGTGVSNHVDQPQKVTYDVAPPAYGPHWNVAGVAPAPFDEKFYEADDRPELEALVHNLEHGYTILWYDETIADDATQLNQIKAIADKYDATTIQDPNFRDKFIAAPWTSSDEDGADFPDDQHVAFTHWKGDDTTSTGVWQYCSEVSGEALETFMDDYPYTDAPEAVVP